MPALRDKADEFLLKELLKRWDNHKVMVRWLSRFFNYLDRCTISSCNLFFCTPKDCINTYLSVPAFKVACVPHRYYIPRHSLHSLKDVGLLRFRGEAQVH